MSAAGRVPPLHAADHVIVGAGVHGLATAGAVARRLRADGVSGRVVVLERRRIGAGASGVAGGLVRGDYRRPAIMEIVRRSVELAAADILDGPVAALEPFRLRRFELGQLQPESSSPYPWT